MTFRTSTVRWQDPGRSPDDPTTAGCSSDGLVRMREPEFIIVTPDGSQQPFRRGFKVLFVGDTVVGLCFPGFDKACVHRAYRGEVLFQHGPG